MSINTDLTKIEQLLSRGVENIYPDNEFLTKELISGRQLTIYTGYDPTADTLHIGHGITLNKLSQFQELGHKIIMLIGDFTGMIGDPTDKSATRKQLTKEEVLHNCKKYQEQASKIINFEGDNPAELKFNSHWLAKMSFQDVIELAANFTVQQMLVRDMFDKRMKEGKPISLHEFLYPLMQGYDSVTMDVDGEVGGNDQTFNMLAGRTLMKIIKNKEKFVLTMKLLVTSEGKKMGKSEGNMVALADAPDDMFGKIMAWTDEMIINGFELCTRVEMAKIKKYEKQLASGENPRDLKLELAKQVVGLFHSPQEADQAKENFINLFSKHQTPDEIEEKKVKSANIIDVLVEVGLAKSKSEARRVVDQKGVKVNDVVVDSVDFEVAVPPEGVILQKGKRFFVKLVKET